jgi:hypothetical protein
MDLSAGISPLAGCRPGDEFDVAGPEGRLGVQVLWLRVNQRAELTECLGLGGRCNEFGESLFTR